MIPRNTSIFLLLKHISERNFTVIKFYATVVYDKRQHGILLLQNVFILLSEFDNLLSSCIGRVQYKAFKETSVSQTER